MVASVAVEEVLLLLKIAFLILLYLFIWRVVRTASRDLRPPQESLVLRPPAPERSFERTRRRSAGRLVVVKSAALPEGNEHLLDSLPLTVGRTPDNDLRLEGDEYASGHHARVEPRHDGVWIVDLGSTNGTFVNDERVDAPYRLAPGDVVRIGETDFRFEP